MHNITFGHVQKVVLHTFILCVTKGYHEISYKLWCMLYLIAPAILHLHYNWLSQYVVYSEFC